MNSSTEACMQPRKLSIARRTVADSIPDSLPLVSTSLNNLRNLLATTADGESRSNVLAATLITKNASFHLQVGRIYPGFT